MVNPNTATTENAQVVVADNEWVFLFNGQPFIGLWEGHSIKANEIYCLL